MVGGCGKLSVKVALLGLLACALSHQRAACVYLSHLSQWVRAVDLRLRPASVLSAAVWWKLYAEVLYIIRIHQVGWNVARLLAC